MWDAARHGRASGGKLIAVNPAPEDASALASRVRHELENAGFTVERHPLHADGGLSVRHDPARGVVVSWGPATGLGGDDVARFPTIRNVVRLALRTILAEAGYQVTEDGGEMVVTGRA